MDELSSVLMIGLIILFLLALPVLEPLFALGSVWLAWEAQSYFEPALGLWGAFVATVFVGFGLLGLLVLVGLLIIV